MKLVGQNGLLAGIFLLISLGFIACSDVHGHNGDSSDTEKEKAPTNKFDWQPIQYDSTKKYIYLSFDDGPQHGTVTCYDLCKTEQIKASFFMVGLHTFRKTDGQKIVSMIRESYPQVLLANHSYTHANNKYKAFYSRPHAAAQDFLHAEDFLHIPFKIARLPGNRAWVREEDLRSSDLTAPVAHLLDSAGYNVIGWDVEWRFGRKNARPLQSAEAMAAEVDSAFARSQTHVRNHVVILTHDRMFRHPSDADSLAKFIHILKQNPQYVFETVDHYPGLKRPVHSQ
jgi:peptidoglycan/xylan/chitin deacetylase (PgdA/CDA1 family)